MPQIQFPYGRPAAPPAWQTPRNNPGVPAATPVNASLALQQQPAPKFRAQAPEAPAAPVLLVLPSPEALGVMPARSAPISSALLPAPAAELDWNQVRQKLRQLGAISFHLDQIAGGNWRATLLVPAATSGAPRHVEALGGNEAAAMAAALAQAEAAAR